MLMIIGGIIFIVTIILAVVGVCKRRNIDQKIRSACLGTGLTGIAFVCQCVDLIIGNRSDWAIILVTLYVLVIVYRVLIISSLVEDKVKGRVD